jgi:predicted MFS family arabinose efflux permease
MPGARLLTRPFVFCSLANLFQALSFNLFLHLPGFLNELGADDLEIGLLFGVTAAAAIAVRPPIGLVMDLRGRRPVILVGLLVNCAACGLYVTVREIGPWIYALRVLHGLGEALLFTALFTLAADLVPAARRTEGLALFGVSGVLPIALGGALGDVILAHADYRALFWTAFGFAALALLLAFPLRDATREGGERAPSRGFLAALGQRDLLPLWWVGFVFSLALAAGFAFLKRFVDDTGLGSVGGFFGAYAAVAVAVRAAGGRLPDRVGPKRVLFPALAALAAGFLVLAGAESARDVLLAGLLCGAGHGYTFPILFGLVVTRAGEADRGSAMAIFTALFDIGVVLGGPAFGAISRSAGFPAMYASAAASLALGTLVFALWDRRNRG